MRRLLLISTVVLLLAACGSVAPAAPVASSAAPVGSATPAALEKITVGLGYIPDVQFAPFYVAAKQGYYAEAGFEVEFQHGQVTDMLIQSASDKLPFVLASGDEVLAARTQSVPVKMVWLLYQKFPVAVFSKASQNLRTPADLKGKTIGIPGKFGATYIGLRGMLYAAGLQESDVNLQEIGFNQFQAVSEDKVPAAVGYANNEPVRLAAANQPVNVLEVANSLPLISNGIVVTEDFAKQNPDKIKRFLQATTRGLQTTIDHPDQAFTAALTYLPELKADQQPLQRNVLDTTLGYWHSAATDQHGLGYQDPAAWQATYTFLRSSQLLTADTDVTTAYTNDFVPPRAASR